MPESKTGLVRMEESEYLLLQPEAQNEFRELFRANIGEGGQINPLDLPRDKVGTGGAIEFRKQAADGTEVVQKLDCIVVSWRPARLYWKDPNPSGKRPDCSSKNGFIGIGDPGGNCETCPYAQYGSSLKGGGQACKQIRQMLILYPEEILPHVVTIPPTSLKACGRYFLMLLGLRLPYWSVVTRIQIEAAQNETGVKFAKMGFFLERRLNPEERELFAPIQRQMAKLLDPMTVDANDYDHGTAAAEPAEANSPDDVPF